MIWPTHARMLMTQSKSIDDDLEFTKSPDDLNVSSNSYLPIYAMHKFKQVLISIRDIMIYN